MNCSSFSCCSIFILYGSKQLTKIFCLQRVVHELEGWHCFAHRWPHRSCLSHFLLHPPCGQCLVKSLGVAKRRIWSACSWHCTGNPWHMSPRSSRLPQIVRHSGPPLKGDCAFLACVSVAWLPTMISKCLARESMTLTLSGSRKKPNVALSVTAHQ